MITRLFLIVSFVFVGALTASVDLTRPLSLGEMVSIAMENHPETRQAWWNAQRAAAAVGSAKSAYYPQVDINANASHGRDFKFINGPDATYTIVGADLVLSMILLDFGARSADLSAAKMALSAANWQTDWTLQKVMVRVLENGYAALYAQEALEAVMVSHKEAERLRDISKELNRAGLSPISDVYTTQSTLAEMNMKVSEHRAQLDIHKGKLATSLGLDADTALQIAPISDLSTIPNGQTAELIALAKQRRADLQAKHARLKESLFRLDQARAAYRPKLSLSGRGGGDHAVHDKANGAHYQIALNLDVPLFNGFDTMYRNRMAYADMELSKGDLAELELEISLEVLTYSRSLQAAQEMLSSADDYLDNAGKAYEGVLEKYKVGEASITTVSDALQQLANARLRYSDVRTQLLVSMANLAYATGTLQSCETK